LSSARICVPSSLAARVRRVVPTTSVPLLPATVGLLRSVFQAQTSMSSGRS
jgi:hypothetical protein